MGIAASGSYPPTALARIESKARSPNPQRAITPYYRVNGRDSSRAGAGRDGRLTADERPIRTKSRRKMMGSPIFLGIEHIIACRKSRRLRAAIRNRDLRGIESPAGDIESISRDFDAGREANRQRNSLQGVRSRVAHAVPIAEPSACHQGPQSPETCAQTRDTGYRPFARNARQSAGAS